MNEGDDGMSAAVAVGLPVVGYREEGQTALIY